MFLNKTSIPKVSTPKWNPGVPTPLNDESLSPIQKALSLLTGFATGTI